MDIDFKIWKLIPTYENLGLIKITMKHYYFSFRDGSPYAVIDEDNYLIDLCKKYKIARLGIGIHVGIFFFFFFFFFRSVQTGRHLVIKKTSVFLSN